MYLWAEILENKTANAFFCFASHSLLYIHPCCEDDSSQLWQIDRNVLQPPEQTAVGVILAALFRDTFRYQPEETRRPQVHPTTPTPSWSPSLLPCSGPLLCLLVAILILLILSPATILLICCFWSQHPLGFLSFPTLQFLSASE